MLQQAGQNQLAGVKTEIRSPVPLLSFTNNYLLAGPPSHIDCVLLRLGRVLHKFAVRQAEKRHCGV